jgi:ABC-2 type transport system permease protein
MKSYIALVRGSYMIGLVYRFGFLFTVLGNIVYLGVAYYLWSSIYEHADVIRGLTFDETFLYVAMGSVIFILLKTYTDWEIAYQIREGIIASQLTKPLDFQMYMLCSSLGFLLMNLTAIVIPTVLMLAFVFKVEVSVGPGLFLFPVSLVFAFVIMFAIDYFIGLLAFYSESVWGLSTTKEVVITVLAGALIPLQFFPGWLQNVVYWLPFQAIYHTPLMLLTRPDQSMEILLSMLLVQFIWVVVLVVLSRLFYNQAIKVLRISGG